MSEAILLNEKQVEALITMKDAINAVEKALKLQAQGKVNMPPKLYLELPEFGGDYRAMPAYIDGVAGLKFVSVYPGNVDKNIRSVLATIFLCDCNTGSPLAIMDGTYITNLRTGAAGGIAIKYLARKDSKIIGMVGGGTQAITQLMAINEVLPSTKEVKVYDIRKETSWKFVKNMSSMLGLNIIAVDSIENACEADIVVTTTPSRKPVVKKKYIKPGTHINAIGADAQGKQELESLLVKSAKIVIDDYAQASHSGEINVPLSEGIIEVKDIYGTLGEVVAGKKRGRENNKEITMFDSTGLAIQDMICAKLVYEKASKNKKNNLTTICLG